MSFRIGVLAIGPSLGLIAQISVVSIPSEIRPYVSVLTYGTEPYDRALKELVPTSSVSTISSMLPYSVILQNISNDTIKGINVVFRIEGQDGKIRPNSVLTTVLDALDKPVLTPTRYQFFCPSPTLYSAIRARQPLEDLARDGSFEQSARELSRERQISVAVESIITSSGTFLGPDSLGLFKALVARQDAEEWLAARLTALSGLPAAQKAELERLSQTQVGPSFGPFQRDDYNKTLRDHARGMLRQMELKRGDAPSEFIARVARSTRVRKP